MPKTMQKNFRLAEDTVAQLDAVARRTRMDKTQVVERCLAMYAAQWPEFRAESEAVLARVALELAQAGLARHVRKHEPGHETEVRVHRAVQAAVAGGGKAKAGV